MKKDLTFYLAHPFDNRYEIREWELEFEKKTRINLINPFYDTIRTDVEKIELGRAERYAELNPKELVERDVGHIIDKKTDGTLAFITGALSYGTIMEMVYTKLNKKPVYSIITNGHNNHPWLKYHSTKIFTKLDDFENWISRDCKYSCGGKMNAITTNPQKKFDLYLCNSCDRSWLEVHKDAIYKT